MAQAIKTCKDTQICTYEDFRIWTQANGQYVPDWKSETYLNIKTRECMGN